jgi:hypothetical protein
MSGFEYHIRCPTCGLTSPVIPFGRTSREPSELQLPAANRVTHDFEVVSVPVGRVPNNVPLVRLAQAYSDDTCHATAPVPTDAGLTLDPAIPCPRCGACITKAVWGGPQPIVRELRSLEDLVEATRDIPRRASYRFVPPDSDYWVECRHDSEGGLPVNRWSLHRVRQDGVDLQRIADALLARLTALGSRCADLRMRPRNGSFTEWPQASEGE